MSDGGWYLFECLVGCGDGLEQRAQQLTFGGTVVAQLRLFWIALHQLMPAALCRCKRMRLRMPE